MKKISLATALLTLLISVSFANAPKQAALRLSCAYWKNISSACRQVRTLHLEEGCLEVERQVARKCLDLAWYDWTFQDDLHWHNKVKWRAHDKVLQLNEDREKRLRESWKSDKPPLETVLFTQHGKGKLEEMLCCSKGRDGCICAEEIQAVQHLKHSIRPILASLFKLYEKR